MPVKLTFKLGTAVRIQANLDTNNPTSVNITIEDPYDTIKVNRVAMTQVASNVYEYVWQSNEDTDNDGNYLVTIRVISGSYTSIEQTSFALEDIDK